MPYLHIDCNNEIKCNIHNRKEFDLYIQVVRHV